MLPEQPTTAADFPFVSIIMTAYNREKYIAEAIESVLKSTYNNFELIVMDDASTDNTVSIARLFEQKDRRLKVFVNEKNLTQFPNRNKAAKVAKGWLLITVDSDDTILPDGIEYIVQQFLLYPEANFATIYHYKDIMKTVCLPPRESIRNHFFKEAFLRIGPSGTVINREYFHQIGGFPEKYGPVGDMYYNLKAGANTATLLMPYIYFNYRRHEQQEINNAYSYLCDGYRYIVDVMNEMPELPLSSSEKKAILKDAAWQNIRAYISYMKNTGELRKTIKAFRLSKMKWTDLF